MPKIQQEVVDGVFFLFKNKHEADIGKNPGGTGFIISVPSEKDPNGAPYLYAVSNHHVVASHGYSVITLNCTDGTTDTIEFEPHEWFFDLKEHGDVAAVMINDDDRYQISSGNVGMFITKEDIKTYEIGVGDDVFMIGLFLDSGYGVNHKRNTPMARFGNISMMPNPHALFNPSGSKWYGMREYFILDLHSRSGFSGSPVFLFRTTGADLTKQGFLDRLTSSVLFKLLGMHCGQFREDWEFEHFKDQSSAEAMNFINTGKRGRIVGLSGMTMAVPGWDIAGLLHSDKLRQERRQLDLERPEPQIILESGANNPHGPSTG